MKHFQKIFLTASLGFLLAACTLSTKMATSPSSPKDESVMQQKAQMSPTPTLTKENSLESIESDLKSTTILEEDFSDIK